MNITDKVAIVTGASKGIGRATGIFMLFPKCPSTP
ncbi:MAG: SDR family oxidoreductase [bacterium]|nr:SDR family oxidoreductase [bacterium]